jgi:hypothetical protein
MKTSLIAIIISMIVMGGCCSSQPGPGMKPPSLDEHMKMIDEKICRPLKLDTIQASGVKQAFKDFFMEMEKLVDKSSDPPRMPEKTKVEALEKIRIDKVSRILPKALFDKYLELDMAARPKGPPEGRGREEAQQPQ